MNTENEFLLMLDRFAANDKIYQAWYQSYLDSVEAFSAFAKSQPESIRNILYAYADGGRLAMQRKLLLAYQHILSLKEE